MSRLAALTGATGFLGAEVARQLVAGGWRLRALTRRWPDAIAPLGTDLVPGDLADTAALDRLVDGADAIIHVAGAIKGDPATLHRVNVAGTEALARAWRAGAPEACFVHVSSMAAREPDLSPYAATKRESEAILQGGGGRWRILRPAAIYGPGDRETLKIFRLADAPLQPLLNGPDARVCLVHVADVAAAVIDAVDNAALSGPVEITDARTDGYTWHEIIRAATAALGRPMRSVHAPRAVLRLAGGVGDALTRIGLPDLAPSTAKIAELLHADWSAHCARADDGPSTIGIEEGFRETVIAYRRASLL